MTTDTTTIGTATAAPTPSKPASDPTAMSWPASTKSISRIGYGHYGNTLRRAVFTNNGRTLLGFTAHTPDNKYYWASPRRDQDSAIDVDHPQRQWFGPFAQRMLAEVFLLGWAGGHNSEVVALFPSPVATVPPPRTPRPEDELSGDEINGIGYALFGDGVRGLDDNDVLAVHTLDNGCVVAALDVRGGDRTAVCAHCETAEPLGDYTLDAEGLTAWHEEHIG